MGKDRQRAEDKPAAETVRRRQRPQGTGPWWVCGNCKSFKTPYAEEGTCEGAGISATDVPCAFNKRWHGGEFEPVKLPEAWSAIDFHKLDAGEVALMRFMLDWRDEEYLYQPRTDLTVGQRVIAKVSGQLRPGVITGFGDGQVAIKTDGGVPLKCYPGSVEIQADQ